MVKRVGAVNLCKVLLQTELAADVTVKYYWEQLVKNMENVPGIDKILEVLISKFITLKGFQLAKKIERKEVSTHKKGHQ